MRGDTAHFQRYTDLLVGPGLAFYTEQSEGAVEIFVHPLDEATVVTRYTPNPPHTGHLDFTMTRRRGTSPIFMLARVLGENGTAVYGYEERFPSDLGVDAPYQVIGRHYQEGTSVLWKGVVHFPMSAQADDLPQRAVIAYNLTRGRRPELVAIAELLQNDQVAITWLLDDIPRGNAPFRTPLQYERRLEEMLPFFEIPRLNIEYQGGSYTIARHRVYLPRFPRGVDRLIHQPWQALSHGLETFHMVGDGVPRALSLGKSALLIASGLTVFAFILGASLLGNGSLQKGLSEKAPRAQQPEDQIARETGLQQR